MKEDPKNNLKTLLEPYQNLVEDIIKRHLLDFGAKNKLQEACEYALLNGGKRFRPVLVLMIAKALGLNADVSEAALAVEYFHTSSLIADDLPCMDNDDERRNKPSTHKVYGESVALLASYALIAAGYECIAKNAEVIAKSNLSFSNNADRLGMAALLNATHNTGILGAAGGQYLDMFPADQTLLSLNEIIHKKTISLFEISFVFGWLFGGGDIERLPDVKKAAGHFGMAFQIADDIDDMSQDTERGSKVNVALNLGKEMAFEMVKKEIEVFFSTMDKLEINTKEFKDLAKTLLNQSFSTLK